MKYSKYVVGLIPLIAIGLILFYSPTSNQNMRYDPPKQSEPFVSQLVNQDSYPVEVLTTQITELNSKVLREGQGDLTVQSGQTVRANYRGWLATTGEIFDQSFNSTDQGIEFSLNAVIQGWQEGVPGMKIGEVRRLYIPYIQAYGESGSASIPPKSDLIFDVELIEIL